MGWPKYLRKVYNKEELHKRVLKKVQLDHDREFLASLFLSEKRGEWSLKQELSKEEIKRLKKIVKEIKAGKGGVKTLPFIILLVLAGGLTVFTLLIKNPLGERLMESSLESVFGATVDMDNFKVSLINTRLEWDRLAITDEANPERNLIESGFTRVSLNGRALLKKKLVMESLEWHDLEWDTQREIRGELIPGTAVKGGETRERKALPFLDVPGGSSVNNYTQAVQDPKVFVQNQWDSLKTPQAAQRAADKYEKIIPGQKEKITSLQNSSLQIKAGGEEFLSRDFSRYQNNPAEIPQLVKEADEYKIRIDSLVSQVQSELKSLEDLRQSLEADKSEILMLKDQDYQQLRSIITLPQGGVEGLFKEMVQSYAASLLGDRYAKAMTIALYVQKYRELATDKEAKSSRDSGRRQGRIISFDSTDWPSFLLKSGYFSAAAGDLSWKLEAHDITGEPDLWDKPVSLELALLKGEGSLNGQGELNLKSDGDSPSTGQVDFTGLPVSSDALSSLGISRFSGRAKGETVIDVDSDSYQIYTNLILSDTRLDKEGTDQITDLVYSLLSREDWKMGINLEGAGEQIRLDLDWPLLSRMDDQIGVLLQEQADEFLEQAEEELTRRFAGELGILDQYTGDLDGYSQILKGDLSSLNKQKEEINNKIEEIKAQAASQASDRTNEVLESTGAKEAVESVGSTLKKLF